MTSQEALELVQKHRNELINEISDVLDGATVAGFLLLTFAMDLNDHKLDAKTLELMKGWAEGAVKEAKQIGFGFESTPTTRN